MQVKDASFDGTLVLLLWSGSFFRIFAKLTGNLIMIFPSFGVNKISHLLAENITY